MKPVLSFRGIHYLASRFGWPTLKAQAFDAKFIAGHWGSGHECLFVSRMVARTNNGGRIAVLGCGVNSLGKSLSEDSYSSLHGIDLSSEALKLAQSTSKDRQYFHKGDMRTWSDGSRFDTVVFHESINYIKLTEVLAVLNWWRGQMTSSGKFIVTISESKRYAEYLDLLRYNTVLEDCCVENTPRRAIVFLWTPPTPEGMTPRTDAFEANCHCPFRPPTRSRRGQRKYNIIL